jgi:trimethylamine---corrinoid protein Co-methyltransferase
MLTQAEMDAIHGAVLRIMAEMGMWIESDDILHHLEGYGCRVDYTSQRARFPAPLVERFIADSEKVDWDRREPSVSASSGVYRTLYHDPDSGQLVDWTEESLVGYFAMARALPNVGHTSMLGCPLPGIPPRLEPLYERLYCWKYGAGDSGTMHLDELCPYIYDLHEIRAQYQGKALRDVFRGTAYLVPPLKLGRHEAYQYVYFYERGLQVHLGDMYAMGATAPVTGAGAVALNLAECLAIGIMQRAFFGGTAFGIGTSLSPLDMRTMIYPYGRPELAITNMATAAMARYYGLPGSGHSGLSDAKLPSVEAGYQKALTAITTLLSWGHVHMDAGLLSIDEVCSPLQMILDNEFLGALRHLARGLQVNEETLGVETILEAGPGGNYMATEHTARHFRDEFWEPSVWSRLMLSGWFEQGRKLDVDYARDLYHAMQPDLDVAPRISREEETDIRALIQRTRDELGSWAEA